MLIIVTLEKVVVDVLNLIGRDPQDRCMFNPNQADVRKIPDLIQLKIPENQKKLKVVARKTKSNPRQKELMTLTKDLQDLVNSRAITLDQAIILNNSNYEPGRSATKVAEELLKEPRKVLEKNPGKVLEKNPRKVLEKSLRKELKLNRKK